MANNISLGIIIGAALSGTVGRTFQTLDAKAVGLGKSLQSVRLGRAASDDVMQYRTKLANLTAAQHQFGSSNTNLVGQIARTELALGKASEKARKYGIDVGSIVGENRKLIQSEQALSRQLARTNALKANRDRRSELGGQMVGTIGMAYAASAPISEAVKFETAMVGVSKQVSGARDPSGQLTGVYADMRKQIQMLGREMPVATNGIADMVTAGARMGVEKENLIGFAKVTGMMATAFELPEGELADNMGKIAKLYNIPIKNIEGLADTINYLDDNAIAKGGDIISFLSRVGGVAASVKIGDKSMAALGSTLLTLGETTDTAGTATNAMFQKLANAEGGTKDFKEAMGSIGLSLYDVQKGMQIDGEGTFLKVLEAIRSMPKGQRLGIMADLVGMEHSDTMAKLVGGIEEYRSQIKMANSEAAKGSISKEFSAQLATTAAQLTITKNRATELAVNLGSVLLPGFNTALGAAGGLSSDLADLSAEFPGVTKVVIGATVGLIGLKVTTLAVGYAVTVVKDVFTVAAGILDFFQLSSLRATGALVAQKAAVLGAAIQQKALATWTGVVTTAQWLWNAAIIANPIGAMVAVAVVAVAALGAAVYYIYNNWGGITTWFSGVFTAIGGVVTTVGSAIGAAFFTAASSVRAVWEPVINWLAEKFAWIGQSVEWIKGIGSSIGGVVSSAASNISQQAKGTVLGAAMASTVAAPALATPLPAMPPAAGSAPATAIHQTNTATIHITQQPGEDQNALAERVAKHLKRQQAADARGALHD
ncbi:TP901 family phage tail tape measure protein [Methylobacter tundripaludum]|uniref:TP901 family phage tail tape measure protein n=1 Tax=Methylobacter tundripaludum TaxID=173365 RepID=A0A2S6H5C4_9GAMM|nr:phage tail tape measure protein [Methylobacter tundripaludum]PPK72689.1 TP901 family phage tail tape measure protein [Methylobacter tundripaludum]